MSQENTFLCVVVTGNPVDGIQLWGPFRSIDDAVQWAEEEYREPDWHIAELFSPES